MTNLELIKAVKDDKITREILDALVDFVWSFDPYGIMDSYGHIDDDGVREEVEKDILYVVKTDPENLIEMLKED